MGMAAPAHPVCGFFRSSLPSRGPNPHARAAPSSEPIAIRTTRQKVHSHQSNPSPRLSGLPPDPRRLSARTANLPSCAKRRSWRRSRVVARGAMEHDALPSHPARARGLADRLAGARWRHGSAGCAGRSDALRAPSTWLSNMRPLVLAGCGLLNTRHDTRLGAVTSDKAGAESQKHSGWALGGPGCK